MRVASWIGLGHTLCFRQCKGKVVFLLVVSSPHGSEGFLRARALRSFLITDPLSFKGIHIKGPVNLVGMRQATCTGNGKGL